MKFESEYYNLYQIMKWDLETDEPEKPHYDRAYLKVAKKYGNILYKIIITLNKKTFTNDKE